VTTTTPEQPLQEVLHMMGTQDINQVPVVENGRLVGLLNRESVIRYLQVRQNSKGDEKQYVA
jgi:CBS domain-containing protein